VQRCIPFQPADLRSNAADRPTISARIELAKASAIGEQCPFAGYHFWRTGDTWGRVIEGHSVYNERGWRENHGWLPPGWEMAVAPVGFHLDQLRGWGDEQRRRMRRWDKTYLEHPAGPNRASQERLSPSPLTLIRHGRLLARHLGLAVPPASNLPTSLVGCQEAFDELMADLLRPRKGALATPRPETTPAASSTSGVGGSEGGPSHPDGPFPPDGFRYEGITVRFKRAARQYQLVSSLWTEPLFASRLIQEVIDEVYGDENDTSEAAFRQLCSDTRRKLETANCPITIETLNGSIQFRRL
jgi:hypothetical protein